MTDFQTGFAPRLTFLGATEREKIAAAVFRLLEETGMILLHDDALSLLKNAGAAVNGDRVVRLPHAMVEKALATVPANVTIYDREGRRAMDLGGRRAYFGTGSDLMWAFDAAAGQRRRTCLEDIATAARVCDGLANIDFIMSFAHPHELPANRVYLESFRAMVQNSTKPIVNTADNRHDLAAMWEIAKILRGGERQLREKPYWIQYDEPISPLKHPFGSVDKLIFCAQTGSPVIYSPAPIAGSTAPMTIAGHVVQGLAECFFGLVIHQLTAPGGPFLMGVGPAVMDMATSQCSYNAPEYLMAYMATVEMSCHFDIPNWGYAGTSDSQLPDMQAAFEGGLETFMAAMAGSNLNHDVGYLDFGLTGSLEMIVIMDEIIGQVRRMACGIPVDDDSLAVPVIGEGTRQGQFLTHAHTLKHLRKVQWRPGLMNRQGHEKWSEQGRLDLLARASRRLKQIVDAHRPREIGSEKMRAVGQVVDRYAGQQGV